MAGQWQNRRWGWITTVLYGFVAVGGYGLHALEDCSRAPAAAQRSAHQVRRCSCRCTHSRAQNRPAHPARDTHGTTTETAAAQRLAENTGPAHDPHNCLICGLLAKVKVGGTIILCDSTPFLGGVSFCIPDPALLADGESIPAKTRGPPTTI